MNVKDPLFLIFTRNAFYKRMHYLALAALALNFIAIGILIAMLLHLIRFPTPPVYFATNPLGRLIDIIPVNKPHMTNDEVIQWTNEAIEAAYSYNYVNYAMQLQAAQRFFTNYGWSEFMRSLAASNNLDGVISRKLVGIAKVIQKPKILAQGLLAGAYAWKFEMPVLVTYLQPPYDDESKYSIPLTVTVIVQRQPILQSYKGLGIIQTIAETATTAPAGPQEISGTTTR